MSVANSQPTAIDVPGSIQKMGRETERLEIEMQTYVSPEVGSIVTGVPGDMYNAATFGLTARKLRGEEVRCRFS